MPTGSEQAHPLLEVTGLTKSFLGQRVLDDVRLTLHRGEIHALLGENGAGKSTLIKAVTGVVQRDAGTVRLDGVDIMPRDSEDAVKAGIATVYQEVNLLPNLNVAENLYLGRQPTRFGLVRNGVMRRDAATLLRGFGLTIDVGAPLGDYSVAVQHLVAIARAVDMSARVLILDEPTASLDAHEVEILFRIMRQLAARGIGIIFITHFLDQVYAISDRITVLRNGRLVGEQETLALPRLDLVHMMLGRELSQVTADREHHSVDDTGAPYARFHDFGKRRFLAPFDLTLRIGQVVAARFRPHRNGAAGVRRGACRYRRRRGRGQDGPPQFAARCHPSWVRLLPGRAQDRGHRCRSDRAREHRAGAAGKARLDKTALAARTGCDRETLHQAAGYPSRRSGAADRPDVGRQSAEGAAGAVARHRSTAADPR
jgi:ABC-type multidrug transport system ATPase subunit